MNMHAANYRKISDLQMEAMKEAWHITHPGQKLRNPNQIVNSMKALRIQTLNALSSASASQASNSAGYTLLLILEALDRLPRDFDLRITSIQTRGDSASLVGSVPDLEDMEQIEGVITNSPNLTSPRWGWRMEKGKADTGDRRSFNMSLRVASATSKNRRK